MNVVLRPDGMPDVEIGGRAHDLATLNKQIRTLLAARRWLKKELEKEAPQKKVEK